MDQIANWVRFADTKATILTAGLGIVLTMLMSNADIVSEAIKQGRPDGYLVGTLAGLTLVAVGYTLFWLGRAITPRSQASHNTINRFAWPTLVRANTDQLIQHTQDVDARIDAWHQVIDLSVLADRKFDACGHAVRGFAVLVILGPATVAAAVGFAA